MHAPACKQMGLFRACLVCVKSGWVAAAGVCVRMRMRPYQISLNSLVPGGCVLDAEVMYSLCSMPGDDKCCTVHGHTCMARTLLPVVQCTAAGVVYAGGQAACQAASTAGLMRHITGCCACCDLHFQRGDDTSRTRRRTAKARRCR